jgi:hypothetical protein
MLNGLTFLLSIKRLIGQSLRLLPESGTASNKLGKIGVSYHHDFVQSVPVALIVCTAPGRMVETNYTGELACTDEVPVHES